MIVRSQEACLVGLNHEPPIWIEGLWLNHVHLFRRFAIVSRVLPVPYLPLFFRQCVPMASPDLWSAGVTEGCSVAVMSCAICSLRIVKFFVDAVRFVPLVNWDYGEVCRSDHSVAPTAITTS